MTRLLLAILVLTRRRRKLALDALIAKDADLIGDEE